MCASTFVELLLAMLSLAVPSAPILLSLFLTLINPKNIFSNLCPCSSQKEPLGVEEMVQWVKAVTAFPEDSAPTE